MSGVCPDGRPIDPVIATGRANPAPPVQAWTPVSYPWTSAANEAFLAHIGKERGMDDDYRELAHRLFAAATAMLEDAIEIALAGQSRRLNPSQLADAGRRLQAAARDIAVIAEAAMIVANSGINQHPNRPKRPH